MRNIFTQSIRAFALFSFLILLSATTFAQVGINTTTPKEGSILDVEASDLGIYFPRVNITNLATLAPITGVTVPANAFGLLVYNTNNTTGPGYFYWTGSVWSNVGNSGNDDWKIAGNGNTTNVGNFLGTTNNEGIRIKTNSFDRFDITGGTLAAGGRLQSYTNGTLASPIYSWSTDTGIGMYRIAANQLGLTALQVSVNGAPLFAGDRFTVRGAANEYAVNGYSSGANGVGVYGDNATTGGVGVFGNVLSGTGVLGLSTTNNGIGVDGRSTLAGRGVQGVNSGTGLGVIGFSTSTGVGVQGQNDATGLGVFGVNTANGIGVEGDTAGAGVGVLGFANSGTGFGMWGFNQNATGTGLLATGTNSATTYLTGGTGIAANGANAILAYARATGGTGLIAVGNNSPQILTYGGGGIATSGTTNGIYAYAGNGNNSVGNRGNAAGVFVLDTDNNISTVGNNDIRARAVLAGYDNIYPLPGPGTARDSYFGGYFSGGNVNNTPTYAFVGMRYWSNNNGGSSGSTIDYKIVGTGSVSTLVKDNNDTERVLFAPEAPEVVFQDYGVGQMINGEARITIDPLLKKSIHVDAQSPLKVFVTLEGDCNGVYVTNKSADGFTVKELQNGRSSVPFSWQIVATRADTKDARGNIVSKHQGVRFPEGPGPLNMKAPNLVEAETTTSVEAMRSNAKIQQPGHEINKVAKEHPAESTSETNTEGQSEVQNTSETKTSSDNLKSKD